MAAKAWPTEIRLSPDKRTLTVAFDDGSVHAIPAELLRVQSPSAEVQGHGAGQRKTVPGKRDVTILGVDPVGSYAVKLRFDDGHDTGLFTWDYLRSLGADQERLLADYARELADKGLSRDPPRRH